MRVSKAQTLKFLNACFQTVMIEGTTLPSEEYDQNFATIRDQLLHTILLNATTRMWQTYRTDLSKFKEEYLDTETHLPNLETLISDFFKKNSASFFLDKPHTGNGNCNKLEENSISVDMEIPKLFERFNEFWDLCCDLENISIRKRDSREYSYAKIDAFIYFNALHRYYDDCIYDYNIENLKKDMELAGVKILSLEKVENLRNKEDTPPIENIYDNGIESSFFDCPLLMTILISYSTIKKIPETIKTQNYHYYYYYYSEIYSSLLFYPASLIVKQMNTTNFAELSRSLHIITGDKDFWGDDWSDDGKENKVFSDDEIDRISNKIIENTRSGITNLLRKKESINKLPPIPAFEDAVKAGYFTSQDSDGHYRTIKSLALCFKKNQKLIALSPSTLNQYIRKIDGKKYNNKAIENITSG